MAISYQTLTSSVHEIHKQTKMATPFDISILWSVITDIRNALSNRNENTIEALGSIRTAFNYTYNYLKNNHGAYEPNMELAELWNQASTKVMKVNLNLGDRLANKSRFWAHPDIYIELNREDNVVTLKEVIDEMERLRLTIR